MTRQRNIFDPLPAAALYPSGRWSFYIEVGDGLVYWSGSRIGERRARRAAAHHLRRLRRFRARTGAYPRKHSDRKGQT